MTALGPAPGALLLLAATAPASAQTPPEVLTRMVLSQINSVWFDRP